MSENSSKLTFKFSPFEALLRGGFNQMQEFFEGEEFTFFVNGESFVVSLMEALLLSSKVCDSLRCDVHIRSFEIDSCDATFGDFREFVNFIHCSSVENINLELGHKFLLFCRLLGNDYLALVLLALIHPIGCVNLIGRFRFIAPLPPSISVCGADVDCCASLFYLYSVVEVRLLNHELLHQILGSRALRLQTEDDFLRLILDLGEDYREFVNYVEISNLSESGLIDFIDRIEFANLTPIVWDKVGNRLKGLRSEEVGLGRFVKPLPLPSLILMRDMDLSVFGGLENREWKLVYRGSEHGFRASDFHGKCDGCLNTVTVILTTTDCIFGGFTPIGWDSSSGHRADSTKQSFLFRMKDSRNSAPHKFPISNPSYAIWCDSSYGPVFGNGCDICVVDCCNQNSNSYTSVGSAYTNDTGINGKQVFTGEYNFTVKEIEVFSITESK
jgi:hypothetical protein